MEIKPLNLTDGPTIEEFVAKGYKAENYPPQGYAPIVVIKGKRTQPKGYGAIQTKPETKSEDADATRSESTPEPETKYYECTCSNRYIHAGGFQFAFGPYEHVGGMWLGTLETSDTDQIKVLDGLVKGNKHGVYELTKEKFDECHKKKVAGSQSLSNSLLQSEIHPTGNPSVHHAVPLNSEPEPVAAVTPPVVEGAAGLQVGTVNETPTA